MFDPFFDDDDRKAALMAIVDTLLIVGLAIVLILAAGEIGVMAP